MFTTRRNLNIIFLLLLSAFAIYSVVWLKSSLFFIIYLFWFDEFIRTISTYIQVKLHTENVDKISKVSKLETLNLIKSRYFFLFIYFVFIVFLYGLFFHLSSEDNDALGKNIMIFFFRDLSFNICISIAIVREILQIKLALMNRKTILPEIDPMSGHLITLHVSIILGAFLWALTSGKFEGFHLNLGPLSKYAIAIPFFIIKFWVDFRQIYLADKKPIPLSDTNPKNYP